MQGNREVVELGSCRPGTGMEGVSKQAQKTTDAIGGIPQEPQDQPCQTHSLDALLLERLVQLRKIHKDPYHHGCRAEAGTKPRVHSHIFWHPEGAGKSAVRMFMDNTLNLTF